MSRSGLLLVDKPQGITSHGVVARVRRLAGTRKVGHAGTLDPMATGLLLIGTDSSTRLLTYLVGLDKEYTATIRLGQSTTTDDAEGEVVSATPARFEADRLDRELDAQRGTISQTPSSVSAIKVDGKRAYDLVREGVEVELRARTVTISALEILDVRQVGEFTDLDVRVECSSGTYIRAIARDLGATLGVGGHLTALRRTRVGPFRVDGAPEIESLDVETALLHPADVASRLFPVLELDTQQAIDLSHGKRLTVDLDDGGPVAAVTPTGRLAGLVAVTRGVAKPIVNFPTDEVIA